jgi:hypothetical protein
MVTGAIYQRTTFHNLNFHRHLPLQLSAVLCQFMMLCTIHAWTILLYTTMLLLLVGAWITRLGQYVRKTFRSNGISRLVRLNLRNEHPLKNTTRMYCEVHTDYRSPTNRWNRCPQRQPPLYPVILSRLWRDVGLLLKGTSETITPTGNSSTLLDALGAEARPP